MNESEQKQTGAMKPFLIIWSGQAVSLLGSQLVQFALIWWLTETTGSATILATASLAGLLPQVLLGPFVGVLVDRWNRRWTLFAADSSVALATLFLAYLFWAGTVQVGHVFLILFVRALAGAFHWPAMGASTSLMVPAQHLTRIQGLNQMLQGGMNIVSAPVAALLLVVLPIQGILAIDVVTALFAIVPLLFIAIPQPERTTGTQDGPSSFGEDLRLGFRYVRGWPGLMMLIGMAVLINLLLNPAFALLPLLVSDQLAGGAVQLGVLQSALGVGIVAGGILLSVWGGFERRIITTLCGLVGMGTGILMMGLAPASLFAMAVGGILLAGLMMSLTNGPIMAITQAAVAPEMQGRVFTLIGSLTAAMSPVGLVIAGPVADLLGVRVWYLAGGGVTILMGVAGFFIPALLEIENNQNGSATIAAAVEVEPELSTIKRGLDPL